MRSKYIDWKRNKNHMRFIKIITPEVNVVLCFKWRIRESMLVRFSVLFYVHYFETNLNVIYF